MSKDEDFVADDGISTVPAPGVPAGGDKQMRPETRVESKIKESDCEDEDEDEDDEDEDDELEESLKRIFDGEKLSESFKSKIAALFKASVSEAVKTKLEEAYAEAAFDINLSKAEAMEEIERLREELESSVVAKEQELSESAVVYETALAEKLDDYLDVVTNRWLEENKIAVESGIRVQMAESFMAGIRDMFYEHNVDLSEETVDIVADLEEQNAKLQEQANRNMEALAESRKQAKMLQSQIAFAEICEGLTQIEKDRLTNLTENLSFDDIEKYKTDVKTIRESFIDAKPSTEAFNDGFLKETFDEGQKQDAKTKDDVVSAYAKGISNLRF